MSRRPVERVNSVVFVPSKKARCFAPLLMAKVHRSVGSVNE